MIYILLGTFILIVGAFLLYLANPKDIFKIQQVIQEKAQKISSIDKDSDKIIQIMRDQPLEAKPEHIDILIKKFEKCGRDMIYSQSSLYRFFGFTSRLIYMYSFTTASELAFLFRDDVYKKFSAYIENFISGIKNKDFNTCYDSITNFMYLSSIRELPKPMSQKTDECIRIIRDSIDKFPVPLIPLKRDILLGIDPYLYIFIINLDIANRYFHTYASLKVYVPEVVEEERKLIKRLFKRFINSYRKNDIQGQFRIITQLSKEHEKVEDLLLALPHVPPYVYIKTTCSLPSFEPKIKNKLTYSFIHNRINK